jgi:hypothetical protein
MALIAYFYASSIGKASTNAPNLIDRIKFIAETSVHVRVKADIPQFGKMASIGYASTNAPNLVDCIIFRANAIGRCSTGYLARLLGRLPESSPTAALSNQYASRSHRIVTPMTLPMTVCDTYIESISWSGMLGAGHVMEIRDGQGAVMVRAVSGQASDSNFASMYVDKLAINGYSAPVLDSGVLVVYVGRTQRSYSGRS